MTAAKTAKGTLLQRGDGGGSEVFATIGEVTNFSGPSESAGAIDVTSFDDTARAYIGDALADGGEVTADMNFVGDDTMQQGLRTDLRAGTARNFKLVVNDHATEASRTTFSFSAIVTGLDLGGGVGEAYKASITLKLTTVPSVAYLA